jgi:phage-related protein
MNITLTGKAIEKAGYSIYAIVLNKKCPAHDYMETLDDKDRSQILALFQLIFTKGPPKNQMKFKNLGNQIYELKTPRRVRILCFFADSRHPRSLILTQGFFKPPKRKLKREINKALNFHKEYLAQKTINIISL